jgi:adenylate cyclase
MVATVTPSTLILPSRMVGDKLLEAARARLGAFYELGAALGALDTPELLARTVVEHLLKALPDAKRSAMLIGPELSLKAHLPSEGRAAVSTSLARRAMETKQAFIWRASAPSGGMYDSVVYLQTQAALYAPLIWKDDVLGVVCVDTYLRPEAFDEDDLRLIVAMATQAAMFVKNQNLQQALRLEETRRSNLQRQFSPKIANRFLKETGRLQLGGERANPATILTTDVRGFTAHSARLEPGTVMQMLNEMYSACVPIIFRHDGMVDKFIGDSILAVFGCPEPDEQQWEKAVRAAWGMQQIIAQLNAEWRKRNWPAFEIGIGIHTGEVLHGFIGSLERMEYTVIGNTVNLASRYCDGAARGEILISPAVHERIRPWVEVEPIVVRTKHPETEPDLEGYLVKGLAEAETDMSQPAAPGGTGDFGL